MKTTTTPTVRPIDGGQIRQQLQCPEFHVFDHYSVTWVHPYSTHSCCHHSHICTFFLFCFYRNHSCPWVLKTLKTKVYASWHLTFPFMPHYPLFPQYPTFIRHVSTASAEKNSAASSAQLHAKQQTPRYQPPPHVSPSMIFGIILPTSPPPPSLTSTKTLLTTPAPTIKYDGKSQVPQQSQFSMLHQYPFP